MLMLGIQHEYSQKKIKNNNKKNQTVLLTAEATLYPQLQVSDSG